MSVRKRIERDRETGRSYEAWIVDIRYQHPNGRSQRIKRRCPVQTKRGAEQYERQILASLMDGTFGAREKEVTFKDFERDFDQTYIEAELKHATQIAYRSTIKTHLLPAFGDCLLSDITTQRIASFKASHSQGRKPHTVRNTLGVLSRMLNVAVEWGVLTQAPKFSFPKVPAPAFRYLSEAEATRLVKAAGPYWRVPIYLALRTGCRQGELWAMERDQIDLRNGTLRVDRAYYRGKIGLPKHDKVRTVELSPNLVEILRDHLRVVPLCSRLVFPTKGGQPRNERKADRGLRRAATRAGINPLGWHVLRHTFASHLAMRGVPVQVIQQLLGHSRIEETMRYAHLSPKMKRDAVALLDEMDTCGPEEGPTYQVGT